MATLTSRETVEKLRPIDDILFNLMYEDKAACQELIRTVLDDDNIIVDDVVAQKTEANLVGRGVRLDVLCTTRYDTKINVEVQRSDNDDHFKRIRYNASVVTAKNTPKGTTFEDVVEMYVIYISEFDLTKVESSLVHIDSVIRESGEVIDDGLHRIIVNATINDGTKISRLMAHFREEDFNDEEFPESSKMIYRLKNTEEGVNTMCAIVEDYAINYAKEYAEEYANIKKKEIIVETIEKLCIGRTLEEACQMLGYTVDEYNEAKQAIQNNDSDSGTKEA